MTSSLRAAAEEYLAIRQSLGVQLREPASLLRRFVAFVDHAGRDVITRDLAGQWAMESPHVQPATWAARLGIVRRFAIWRQAGDPRTEIPPPGLLPHRVRRPPPHVYTDAEIRRLLTAARALPSTRGLRGLTYATLFALLAATGLRVSEALHLDDGDVARDIGLLTIRRTKFGKSRIVPVHPSTSDALQTYAEARDQCVPYRASAAFFVSEYGTRLTADNTRHTFALVSRQIGLRSPTRGRRHGRGPRLHDLRHRFAASTLIAWYHAGRDVERELPKLATYLGHVHVADTYWYLEAVPELLQLAAARLGSTTAEGAP
jgi:integrase